MKIITLVFLFLAAIYVNASERVFYLEDLAGEIDGGMTADQYCSQKAENSVRQAKASNAPIEAQSQIKKWVSIACNLDIIEEANREKEK